MCVCVGGGLARDLLLLCPLGWGGLNSGRSCPLDREEPGNVVPGSPMLLWGPVSIFISEPQSIQCWAGHILGPQEALVKEELSKSLDE